MEFFGPQTLDLQDNYQRGRTVKPTVGMMLMIVALFILSEGGDGIGSAPLFIAGLVVLLIGLGLCRSLLDKVAVGHNPRSRK